MSAPTLALDATGRALAVPLRYVAGPAAVATKIRMRLDSIRGHWREDTRVGLPLLDWQAAPATPNVVIEGDVRAQVREVPGVLTVERVTVSRANGALAIAVVVTVDRGATGPVRARVVAADDAVVPGAWFTLLAPVGTPG